MYENQFGVISESLVFRVVVDIMRASAWYNNLSGIIRSRYAITSYRLLHCNGCSLVEIDCLISDESLVNPVPWYVRTVFSSGLYKVFQIVFYCHSTVVSNGRSVNFAIVWSNHPHIDIFYICEGFFNQYRSIIVMFYNFVEGSSDQYTLSNLVLG